MANFETHFKASVVTSAALSSVILATSQANPTDTLLLFVIGSLAGLLPDLDADKSRSLNSLFSVFALCIGIFLPIFLELNSLTEIWLSALGAYLILMYAIKPLFERFTVHRGASHSLLNVVMIALLTLNLAIMAGKSINFALLCSVSVTVGMLTHLILDECYSVDINNNEIKASFGSALKPIAVASPFACLLQITVIGLSIYMLTPYYDGLIAAINGWHYQLAKLPLLPNTDVIQKWL
ncbi:metal-dependent hydrolase [Pseudoalteromonas sp. T1lg23B]|uniref:metal-dependent hydrolase n=1 Tax=Pseudoalteromonas sp. T1lg23B TaxID=2077097 RepID=UPI00131A3ADF|nr:metal-dependent hydrolase [Pseudoalteromonas sp. T1lg23B]